MWRFVVALLALLGVACGRPGAEPVAGPACPSCSVVFIVVDTLAADHMSLYGYPRATTPKLDARARELLVFEEAISQSTYTTASVASILTGLYPSRHGVGSHNTVFHSLLPERSSLAEVLRDAGFATAAFNSNPLIEARRGFDQGFDGYDSTCVDVAQHGVLPNCVGEKAVAWLRERADSGGGRFFLYLHFMDVHSPYVPAEPFRHHFYPRSEDIYGKDIPPDSRQFYCFEGLDSEHADLNYYASAYDDGVRYMDSVLDDLLSSLDALALGDVLVVLTSDHGEEFLELGHLCHEGPPVEAQIHVPLVIRHPSMSGARIPANVETIDIAPTLLEILGVEARIDFDGTSLVADLRGEPRPERSVYSEVPRTDVGAKEWRVVSRAIKRGHVKLIENPGEGRDYLFEDVEGERFYSGEDAVEVRRALRLELERRVARLGAPPPPAPPLAPELPLAPETVEALRVLGYGEREQ